MTSKYNNSYSDAANLLQFLRSDEIAIISGYQVFGTVSTIMITNIIILSRYVYFMVSNVGIRMHS